MAIRQGHPDPLLGTVLVTGGCGFLGYHLVGLLLADPQCTCVCVLDINVHKTPNTHPNAIYEEGSVTDPPAVLSDLLDKYRPTVIFHTASPSASYSRRNAFYPTNVTGTSTLLSLARDKPFVKALVYTSSIDIYAHPPLHHATETNDLWPTSCYLAPWYGLGEYDRTKTIAHRMVLAANEPAELKTAAIVPAHVWGVRDRQGLSLFFDSFANPRNWLWQIGDGRNVNSVVEAGNCATAHILAAKALVDPSRIPNGSKVDGEAFNVTDGTDVNFWDDVWAATAWMRDGDVATRAKGQAVLGKIHVIPAWAMWLLVRIVKWTLLIFTMGLMEPSQPLSTNGISWATVDHTLDDSKARKVLRYSPKQVERSKLLREAVEFERKRRRSLAKGKLD